MIIEVTEFHIGMARSLLASGYKRSKCCPLALALKDKFPNYTIRVGLSSFIYEDDKGYFYKLIDDKMALVYDMQPLDAIPPEAKSFLDAFDEGKEVKPFSFNL